MASTVGSVSASMPASRSYEGAATSSAPFDVDVGVRVDSA
jgi:hypothetical protein